MNLTTTQKRIIIELIKDGKKVFVNVDIELELEV